MDFFAAETLAKGRSARFGALFGVAVLVTIMAGYGVLVGLRLLCQLPVWWWHGTPPAASPLFDWWQPEVAAAVTGTTLLIVGLGSLAKWLELRQGGTAVAEMVDGRRVDGRPSDLREQRLRDVVAEMALAAGLPEPPVYVLDREPGINAFAAGRFPADAVIVVTHGALQDLSRDELQGIVAHEFSHILNGDMRLNLRLTAIIFSLLVIGQSGESLFRNDPLEERSGLVFMVIDVALNVAGLGLILAGYSGYFCGRFIQAAVARQRAFLADASAVQFSRNPEGLMGALRKIGANPPGSRLLHENSAELGHSLFAQGFVASFWNRLETHPTPEERIMAIDPGRVGSVIRRR